MQEVEVITILAILVISFITIIYVLYYSSSERQIKRAQKLFNSNKHEKAFHILEKIFDNHDDAPAKLAEYKLTLGQNETRTSATLEWFQSVTNLKSKIREEAARKKYEPIEVKANIEIAQILYSEGQGNIERLNNSLLFLQQSNQKGMEKDFKSLKSYIFFDLANLYFRKGIGEEQTNYYSDAIKSYHSATKNAEKSNYTRTKYDSLVRSLICKVKLKKPIVPSELENIEKASESHLNDFYYRYSISLIKSNDFEKAEKVLSAKTKIKSQDVYLLKNTLNVEKNNYLAKIIQYINKNIETIYKESVPADQLKDFYKTLGKLLPGIKKNDDKLYEEALKIMQTLLNRLLTEYIHSQNFEETITLIKAFPKFWEHPRILKNLGICSYNLILSGNVNNLRISQYAISAWLTAVYSNQVILQSLEDTAWDDTYTFSLVDAIGHDEQYMDKLPENVNYDGCFDTNVSIGATQRELLREFEAAIQKTNESFATSSSLSGFYEKEKKALDNIIELYRSRNLTNDFIFAAPYFSKTNGLNLRIIRTLDQNYDVSGDLKFLEAGTPYLLFRNFSAVERFAKIKNELRSITHAIQEENPAKIREQPSRDMLLAGRELQGIQDFVDKTVYEAVDSKINDCHSETIIISIMDELFDMGYSNSKLNDLYSNRVANSCIAKVNAKKIDNSRALSLMKKAYHRSPNNIYVCSNFVVIIKNNLMDILSKQTRNERGVYAILDWLKKNKSQTFKQHNAELLKTSNEILMVMKERGVDISMLTDDPMINKYKASFSNTYLNEEGRRVKNVINYLQDLGSNQSIRNILNYY